MKNIFVAVVLACAAGYTASSYAVTVKGMENCEAWVMNHATHSLNAKIDSAWLVGYLSGVAVARDIDFLKGVDDDTIKSWMDNYCHSHPQDLIGFAADALSVELYKRMH